MSTIFYVQHKDGIPTTLTSDRVNDDDFEIDEDLATRFYECYEILGEWRISNGEFYRNGAVVTKDNKHPIQIFLTEETPSIEDLVLSLSEEGQYIDIFFDTRFSEEMLGISFEVIIDDKPIDIDFKDFNNGHLRVHANFTLTSTFFISDMFRRIRLVKDFYSANYRSVKDKVLFTEERDGVLLLPQHLYHSTAYYVDPLDPLTIVRTAFAATQVKLIPGLQVIVKNYEIHPHQN